MTVSEAIADKSTGDVPDYSTCTDSISDRLRRVALLLEYEGTGFSGSQAQDHRDDIRTVQGEVEKAVRAFTGEDYRVAFAGRTDSGVHALGQVGVLDTRSSHDIGTFRKALNHFLPMDVAVRAVADVDSRLNPRRHARSRIYGFRIDDGVERSPLRRHRSWQVRQVLDDQSMSSAAAALMNGPPRVRDWSAFAGSVPDGYPTERMLSRLKVDRCRPGQLSVTMEASGFLPQQVRRTVGALMRVGNGKLGVSEFSRMADGPAGSAGPVAPPQGLTLLAVRYDPGTIEWGSRDDAAVPEIVSDTRREDSDGV